MGSDNLTISKILLDDLLQEGNKLNVDGIGKFRVHLRKQRYVFNEAKNIETVIKSYFSDKLSPKSSNYHSDALMSHKLCSVKAPTPIKVSVSLIGRLASVSNLELTNQIGNTTYSLTPQVICNHWSSRSNANTHRKVIPLYQVDMNHIPRV